MSSLFVDFLTSGSLRTFRRLYEHLPYHSRTAGIVRPSVDPDEDEDGEGEIPTCLGLADDPPNLCLSSPYTPHNVPIPFTLHSDVPVSAVCSPSGFIDSYSTSTVTTHQASGSTQFCINGVYSNFHKLLPSCVWLVLGSYVFIVIVGVTVRKSKRLLGLKLAVGEATKVTRSMKPGELIYVSGAPLPSPEEVIQRTLQQYTQYSDSDAAHGFPEWEPLAPKLEPIALTSSSSWHSTLRSDLGVLFRGDITPNTLDHTKGGSPKKASTMSRAVSVPNIVTKSDVPPMPPSIPSFSVTPVEYVDTPSSTPRHPVNAATSSNPNAPSGTSARHRPPPINTGTPRASKLYRDPSHRCFNPSPLKNVSASASTLSPESSPCSPAIQTPALKIPALSDNGLKQSMWAPKA